jgi:pseudouridylate synthase
MRIQIRADVASALADERPVVALESTLISHGLPRPLNFETARRLEAVVKQNDAIPATIAVMGGQLCVGLTDAQIQQLSENNDIKKLTTRDIPIAVAREWDGATTVASTCWIAHRTGIRVFATGGIGGVHRGPLPDISADLPELARTPIIVVCSGAKSVLDLPATREWLETHAVTVVGYQCDEMPAFYSRTSGLPVDVRADSPVDVGRIFRAQRDLGIESALLVTVPVPAEFEVPAEQLEQVLSEALKEATTKAVGGRELTPFLLSRMASRSDGGTLRANVALLENNARVASQIANALTVALPS